METLKEVLENLSDEHKEEIDNMEDKDLVQTWKVYISKSKHFNKKTAEHKKALAIALYALNLHNINRKESTEY